MKKMKLITVILLLFNAHFIHAQSNCDFFCLNFEENGCIGHLSIDTIAFPQNVWQIGQPQKEGFSSAYTAPNAIVTDTMNFYPVNNTSVFLIRNNVTMGTYYGLSVFGGYYNVQSDSLHDYGTMEFSPDNGTTWINLITDTVFTTNYTWWTTKPVLTGRSNGWKYFEILLADIGSAFNIHLGDTVIYRFTFKSDTIPENLGGLMYDNICFTDFVEGITETRFKPLKSTIFPNPSNDAFTIKFENPQTETFQLAIYSEKSKLVYSDNSVSQNKILINASTLMPGIYFYKLTNPITLQRSWGKFIVAK